MSVSLPARNASRKYLLWRICMAGSPRQAPKGKLDAIALNLHITFKIFRYN